VNVLEVDSLRKYFAVRGGLSRRDTRVVRAVDGVSFSVGQGETLSLVGESGCGKSTTARLILRLTDPTDGRILLLGEDITQYRRREIRRLRQKMQIVFQDPYTSLNPRMTAYDLVSEPLRVHGVGSPRGRHREVEALMKQVGLDPATGDRYAHEFSGGQRQRIGIARALALRPALLVLDEPVSALDVSVQAQIVNLLKDLQDQMGLTYVFVSHDLSIVRHLSTQVAVMYMGKIVEHGSVEDVFDRPSHPYTHALLSAVPTAHELERTKRIVLTGDVPDPANPPSGCAFRTRCFRVQPVCASATPALAGVGVRHLAACHFAGPPRATDKGVVPS